MAQLRESSQKELDMWRYWPDRRGCRRLGERKRCQEKDRSGKASTGNDESDSGQQRRGSAEPLIIREAEITKS